MKTKTVRQTVTFRAKPHEVYEALMDSKMHSKFTQAKANISREVGGEFTAYNEFITGTNLEPVPDKKIVQRWRGSDWPKGHCSTATFELKEIEDGTEFTFVQTGVPEEQYEHINEGWHEQYWKKMKKMLEKK